jgi:hypothetical protein
MSEKGTSLEILIEKASRARRFADVLHGDPAADDLTRYAEEIEVEIGRLQSIGYESPRSGQP